ncbi:MAG TPA: class I SAM-dependent methyltransferase [Terriglobales bacterium]|nr:class I SAM-dependent methyltransferase [Terriglobales bacterium]
MTRFYSWAKRKLTRARLPDLDGAQMGQAELEVLRTLASRVAAGLDVVEIGTFRGNSTIALAQGSAAGNRVRVYAVDPHVPFVGLKGHAFGPADQAALYHNLSTFGVGELVAVVCLPSAAVAKTWSHESVGLLWIDGDHRYESVRLDLEVWYPHVAPGGIIAFHDCDCEGVRRTIGEATEARKIERLGGQNLLSWFKKLNQPTPDVRRPPLS